MFMSAWVGWSPPLYFWSPLLGTPPPPLKIEIFDPPLKAILRDKAIYIAGHRQLKIWLSFREGFFFGGQQPKRLLYLHPSCRENPGQSINSMKLKIENRYFIMVPNDPYSAVHQWNNLGRVPLRCAWLSGVHELKKIWILTLDPLYG